MSTEIKALILTAFSVGLLHTLFGPDHYLPFVMISWARKWSALKTACITFLCGIGHILSSVVLGLIGVALGIMVKKLEIIESFRGDIAAWLLIAFGLVYFVWGLHRHIKTSRIPIVIFISTKTFILTNIRITTSIRIFTSIKQK